MQEPKVELEYYVLEHEEPLYEGGAVLPPSATLSVRTFVSDGAHRYLGASFNLSSQDPAELLRWAAAIKQMAIDLKAAKAKHAKRING